MLFNSFEFLVFLGVVLALCFSAPFRLRWALLLGASYYFYAAWRPEYLALILISTGVDYFVGLGLGRSERESARRGLLGLSLAANLGLLFAFKYYNFFAASAADLLSRAGMGYLAPHLDVLLPVGISFFGARFRIRNFLPWLPTDG